MKSIVRIFLLISFFFVFQFSNGQETISGKVTDGGDNTPLIGVNIRVAAFDHIGTITDNNGHYSIVVPQEAEKLIFSYTGYQSKEVKISECKGQTIALTISATFLDEVVVVGFGTSTRSDLTGSVSNIKNEVIEGVPVNSLEATLQGQAAGVFVTSGSGKLGQNIDVRIRGAASINASLEPLYVMDGMVISSSDQVSLGHPRYNPLTDINFNDIESIEILKDASAAAIYGSRASNGVVIITTKKGVKKDTRISLDMNTGWSSPTRKRKWLNGPQYLELWDEAFTNVVDESGIIGGWSMEEWKDTIIPGWRDGYDTNWEDLMYNQDAGQRQIQLNVSGGNDKTTFYLSGGYTDQTSISILSAFERLSGRINLNHQASDKIDLGLNLSLARSIQGLTPSDINLVSPGSFIAQPPVQPLYDPENPGALFFDALYPHALFFVGNSDVSNISMRTIGQTYLNWQPIENLTLHTDVGLDLMNLSGEQFYNSIASEYFGYSNGLKRTSKVENLNYSVNNYARYQITDQDNHGEVTVGMTYQELSENRLFAAAFNFPNDDLQNLSSASQLEGFGEVGSGYSILSYFARLNYNYDQRYQVSLSSRLDGDSRFGSDHRYGFFPALSAGWVISKESFFKKNKLFNYLKFRTSWGITGNTPLDHFASLGLYEGRRYNGNPGYIQVQIPNPDLKWEKTEQIDLGIDFGLLDDRISGQMDYYIKNTNDLLLSVNLPATTGVQTQLRNVGSIKNKGFELQLNSYNMVGAFKWKTSLNLSVNRNTVTDIQGQIIDAGVTWGNLNRVIEGYPIGVFYAPEFAGVNPENGDALYYLNEILENGEVNRDTTTDITKARSVVVGDPNPEFIYGIRNDFSWKGLDLSILFQGVQGNEIFDAGGIFYRNGFGWFDNQDIRILDRWQKPGDDTDIPQLRFQSGTDYSSRFVEDGSYLRLRNISLAYKLPASMIEKLGLRSLQIYVTGQNLWIWTNYRGRDPEVHTDTNDFAPGAAFSSGIDLFTIPQAKTVIVGIRAGF